MQFTNYGIQHASTTSYHNWKVCQQKRAKTLFNQGQITQSRRVDANNNFQTAVAPDGFDRHSYNRWFLTKMWLHVLIKCEGCADKNLLLMLERAWLIVRTSPSPPITTHHCNRYRNHTNRSRESRTSDKKIVKQMEILQQRFLPLWRHWATGIVNCVSMTTFHVF